MSNFEMHQTEFNGDLKNGTKPMCAWCSGELDVSVFDTSWFWFLHTDKKIYFGHTECGQENISDGHAEDFVQWLIGQRKMMEGDDESLNYG